MMKHCKLLCWACAMMAFLTACREAQAPHIKIVCTSDVHGQLFPYDFLTGDSVKGSLARVSSYLKELRQQGDNVIYFDNGDMLQGTPATYCYNTYAVGKTHIAAEVLNYLQCEAVVLGNNDIEPGGSTYQRYADDLDCPVVGGNILFSGSNTPFVPPFTIVEREGVRIALIGLTTPAIPHWIPKCQWPELEFDDMERAARRWMDYLDKHEQPDLVFGLFHSGYEEGIVTDSYAENATRAVAERVAGFDAIFYGHDHKEQIVKVVNVVGDTVLLLNPGRGAQRVAVVDIELDKEGKATLSASLVNMDNRTPDKEYMNVFAPHIERISKYVNRGVGVLEASVDMCDALFGSSAWVDLVHQMQLNVSGAKISFAAPLVCDGALPNGEVTVRDIYRLYPYENNLYVLRLTGREIKDYLEMSYARWVNQMTSFDDHLLLLDRGELKHPYYHFDSAAGIVYEVDVTRPVGKRVNIKCMADGAPFCLDASYTVAMNSYRAHGGGGLITAGVGITHEQLQERIEYSTTADLRFYMINYIEMRKTISPEPLGQWQFVPEGWVKDAGKRDRELLFGRE